MCWHIYLLFLNTSAGFCVNNRIFIQYKTCLQKINLSLIGPVMYDNSNKHHRDTLYIPFAKRYEV